MSLVARFPPAETGDKHISGASRHTASPFTVLHTIFLPTAIGTAPVAGAAGIPDAPSYGFISLSFFQYGHGKHLRIPVFHRADSLFLES